MKSPLNMVSRRAVLPLAAALALTGAALAPHAAFAAPEPQSAWPSDSAQMTADIYAAISEVRSSNGLKVVAPNPVLDQYARYISFDKTEVAGGPKEPSSADLKGFAGNEWKNERDWDRGEDSYAKALAEFKEDWEDAARTGEYDRIGVSCTYGREKNACHVRFGVAKSGRSLEIVKLYGYDGSTDPGTGNPGGPTEVPQLPDENADDWQGDGQIGATNTDAAAAMTREIYSRVTAERERLGHRAMLPSPALDQYARYISYKKVELARQAPAEPSSSVLATFGGDEYKNERDWELREVDANFEQSMREIWEDIKDDVRNRRFDRIGISCVDGIDTGNGKRACHVRMGVSRVGASLQTVSGYGYEKPAEAPSTPVFDRFAGKSRYQTGLTLADSYMGTREPLFVASGEHFADALAAAPVAAKAGGTLIIVDPTGVDAEMVNLIKARIPSHVFIVGGTVAISDQTMATIVDAAKSVNPVVTHSRIRDSSRYGTAQVLLRMFGANAGAATGGTAYVATGHHFADALSVASLAGAEGAPIALVDGQATTLPNGLVQRLREGGYHRVSLVGGTVAIRPEIRQAFRTAGFTVDEDLRGTSRYATAAIIAGRVPESEAAVVATGTTFPDALAAASVAGRNGWPILLSQKDCLPKATDAALRSRPHTQRIALGSEKVVADAAVKGLSVCAE